MNGKTKAERVTDLEQLAESLAPWPARVEAVESHGGQQRAEISAELCALRQAMAEFRSGVRADLAAYALQLTTHIKELQREMRVQHEEVIRRLALTGEIRRPDEW